MRSNSSQNNVSPDQFQDYQEDAATPQAAQQSHAQQVAQPPQQPTQQQPASQSTYKPKAATYQCPNCNGVLTYDAACGKLVCEHCGGVFDEPEHRDVSIPVGGRPAVEQKETEHVTDVEGFLNRTTWGGTNAEELIGAITYSCPSCGASVTADQSVVATSCPYCGNNMLVSGIATSTNLPTKVLPFAITKEEAQQKMREHFKRKWYLSRKFDASLEHMQGVYVPYHLFDMNVAGRVDLVTYNKVSDGKGHTSYTYYAMQRAGHASFKRIPVDCSSKMPDGHMDAIAPFSFDKMRDFSPGYVAGYLMEVPDETPEQCFNKADELAKSTVEQGLDDDACSEVTIHGVETTVRKSIVSECPKVESCVLPVWLMHATWLDHQMLFAVNGETGKCVGDLPVDKTRRNVTRGAIIVAMALICGLILLSMIMGDADSELITKFIWGAIIATFLAVFIVDGMLMSQMKTANEAEDAEMSYDSEGLVITHQWRSRKGYGSVAKAKKIFTEGEKEGVFNKNHPQPVAWNVPLYQIAGMEVRANRVIGQQVQPPVGQPVQPDGQMPGQPMAQPPEGQKPVEPQNGQMPPQQ